VTRAGTFLRSDAVRAGRDPMLILLAALPVALGGATRLAGPAAIERLPAGADPAAVASAAMAVLLLLTPLMFGFVIGLMLLDERDEGVLTAVSITPVGKTGFLAYRMATPVIWSGVAAVLVALLAGLVSYQPAHLAVLAVLAGLQAPLLALFLGAFAADKVRGMALGKVGSVLVGLGAVAVLAPAPWSWLAAPSPHFWLVRLAVGDGPAAGAWSFWPQVAAALAAHLAALWLLTSLFRNRTG
jgi:fluoroquinolone transport system permease protein